MRGSIKAFSPYTIQYLTSVGSSAFFAAFPVPFLLLLVVGGGFCGGGVEVNDTGSETPKSRVVPSWTGSSPSEAFGAPLGALPLGAAAIKSSEVLVTGTRLGWNNAKGEFGGRGCEKLGESTGVTEGSF